MDRKRSILSKAVLSGNYISIRDLTTSFPQEKASLLLAYEESKDLTEYINRKFGRNAILNILRYLKEGHKTDEAILKSLSIPLDELEKRWHAGLGSNMGWFVYLSNNLYGILFFLAALLTIAGFIRLVKKKHDYKDEDDDDIDRQDDI